MATTPDSSKTTSLGKLQVLPPELRLEIFDLVLDDFFTANKVAIYHCEKATGALRPAILDTSKAIRGEARPSYLRRADTMAEGLQNEATAPIRYRAHALAPLDSDRWEYAAKIHKLFEKVEREVHEPLRCVQIWRKGEVREMFKSGCMSTEEYFKAIQKQWKGP